jgi:hypothetical protein
MGEFNLKQLLGCTVEDYLRVIRKCRNPYSVVHIHGVIRCFSSILILRKGSKRPRRSEAEGHLGFQRILNSSMLGRRKVKR